MQKKLPGGEKIDKAAKYVRNGLYVAACIVIFTFIVATPTTGLVSLVFFSMIGMVAIFTMAQIQKSFKEWAHIYATTTPVPMIWLHTQVWGGKNTGIKINASLAVIENGTLAKQYFVPISFTKLTSTKDLKQDSAIFPNGKEVQVYLNPKNGEPAVIESDTECFVVPYHQTTSSTAVTGGIQIVRKL